MQLDQQYVIAELIHPYLSQLRCYRNRCVGLMRIAIIVWWSLKSPQQSFPVKSVLFAKIRILHEQSLRVVANIRLDSRHLGAAFCPYTLGTPRSVQLFSHSQVSIAIVVVQ